jgi:thiamine pyrophosphokinase
MTPDEVTSQQEAGVEVIRFPTHKDETDLELALQFTLKHEVGEVIIIGALGARWDMTIANILLLAHPLFTGLKMRLLDGAQELVLLRAGERLDLHRPTGETISLIPLSGDAHGIITDGLEYPLKDETLKFGTSRGISNVITQQHAKVEFREGLLLCVLNSG